MLCGKSKARRIDEGTIGRDDGLESASHQGLVSKQTLQGQKENDSHETTVTTRKGVHTVIRHIIYFIIIIKSLVFYRFINSNKFYVCTKRHLISSSSIVIVKIIIRAVISEYVVMGHFKNSFNKFFW